MREPGEARSGRKATRFARIRIGEHWMNLPKPSELLDQLQVVGRLKIDGWSIGLTDGDIWLTNHYGLDCVFQPSSIEGCEAVLRWIASDTHERECGSLRHSEP